MSRMAEWAGVLLMIVLVVMFLTCTTRQYRERCHRLLDRATTAHDSLLVRTAVISNGITCDILLP